MNLLEAEFLNYIDWKLWVEPNEFQFYLQGVNAHFEQPVPQPLAQGPQVCGKVEYELQEGGNVEVMTTYE